MMLSRLNDIAQAMRGQRTPRGIKFRCPCHEDSSPSCTAWYGERAIMVKCFAGCPNEAVIDELRKRGFVTSVSPSEKPPLVNRDRRIEDERRKQLAIGLWKNAERFYRSLAERYIGNRELEANLFSIDDALRFHPACPRGNHEKVPALIGAFRDIESDAVVAIQRVFLTPDGRKDGKPMMLGSTVNAAIKLTPQRETFIEGKCELLHVCEGIETGLGAMRYGFRPLWALGSTSNIKGFRPRPSIAEICVCADPDEPGLAAAHECMQQWVDAGHEAGGVVPGGAHD